VLNLLYIMYSTCNHRHSWILKRVIAHTTSRARVKFSAFFMQADYELMFSRFVKLFRNLKNAVVSKVTSIINVFSCFLYIILQLCLPGFLRIQHCFICHPSDSTVSEDGGIEPRNVATLALAVRRSKHDDYLNL
jgi:hypothetical protein